MPPDPTPGEPIAFLTGGLRLGQPERIRLAALDLAARHLPGADLKSVLERAENYALFIERGVR